MHKVLSSIIVENPERSVDVMLAHIDANIAELRKSLGVRPNIHCADVTVQMIAQSISLIVNSLSYGELLRCTPTPPPIVDALTQRLKTFKQLQDEIALCKHMIVTRDVRSRNRSIEN